MDTDADLRALEASLEQLDGVTTARVVADREGAPREVHVLSDGSKAPKQLVRDVQSVALARHGIPIDHRIVSVVFLPGDAAAKRTAADPPRVFVTGLGVHLSPQRYTVDVTISNGRTEASGAAVGPPVPGSRARLVGQAALSALERLYGAHDRLHLEAVDMVELGGRRVAAVVVALLTASAAGEAVSGSAVCGLAGDDDAVVRAVLDATNRRLPRLFPDAVDP